MKPSLNLKTSVYTRSNQLNTPDTKFMLKVAVAQKTEDYCGGEVDCLFQHAPSIPIWCGASMGGKKDSIFYWEV